MSTIRRVTRTMGWVLDRPVLVVVHGSDAPAHDEWQGLIDAIDGLPGKLNDLVALVYSHGGGPSTLQRGQLVDLMNERADNPPKAALLSSSSTVRGIGVALSWFNPSLKILPLHALDPGCDHLGLDPAQRQWAADTLDELCEQLELPPRSRLTVSLAASATTGNGNM